MSHFEVIRTPKIAVMASGSGTTADHLADSIARGNVGIEIDGVVYDRPNAGVQHLPDKWNRRYGFDTDVAFIPALDTDSLPEDGRGLTPEQSSRMAEYFADRDVDLVVCLGFLTIVKGDLMTEWGFLPDTHDSMYDARMLNNHPSLLPLTADTYGENASAVVLEAYRRGEVEQSAFTMHVVAPKVDAGPKVLEIGVDIAENDTPDTLFKRVQVAEKAATGFGIAKFWYEQQQYVRAA